MIQQKLPITFLATIALLFCSQTKAQLYINSATFFIQPGATVTVQGNVTSNTNIQGTGTVILNGSSNQTVDMGGNSIQNLQVNNPAGSTLLSNLIVGKSLAFTSGTITLGSNSIFLYDTTVVSGEGAGNFIATNGTGQAIVNLTGSNFTSYVVPVGQATTYRPAILTTTGSHTASANVGVRVATAGDPNKPPMISDYLLAYWPITQTGITGTLSVAGQYNGTSDISGSQTNLKGYFFNGTDWSSASGTSTTGSNQVATTVTGAGGDVYGMDGFIVLKAKVFLQGAYNTSTGVMSYGLMTKGLLPLTDPYRVAPYNSNFTQVADANTETTTTSVLTTQATSSNNIVDWVFVELRSTSASPGNTVLQTRSALLQSNGNIVDMDGTSPITFNNIPAGNYRIGIRHRNHLEVCINATSLKALSETNSTATTLDFTNNISQLYAGTVSNTAAATVGGSYAMWGGDANESKITRYGGPSNDENVLLNTTLSGNKTAVLAVSSYTSPLLNSDLNLDGTVRYGGPNNDENILLNIVLAGNKTAVITQPTY